jgi:cell division protease FtsH
MVDLLEDEIRELLAPRVYDTHNALVFVAGNLDDAYGMAFDVEVDSDADVMKSQSQAIGLPEIKSALLRRYRPEQIARLGNRHLIYPAFGRKEYEEIIARTAQEVLSRYGASYGFELEASPSLLSIVYQEGVAPAQGVRPVLSTVDQLVTSRLPAIYLAACELDEAVDRVVLEGCTSGNMETKFYRGGRLLGQTSDRVVLLNQKARDQKTPATRAVISVHEAGHALVQLLRTGVFPTRLTSVTANRSLLGYSATRRESGVKVRTAQDEFVNMEVLFGGLVAEEVLFGKEQATAGSGDDILQATRSAGLMIKKRGQGSVYYHGDHQASECEWSVKAEDAKLDIEVADTLAKAHASARQLLEEHKSTLVALSHELYVRGTLTEEDLRVYWVQELGLALPEVQVQDFDAVLEAAFQQHHGLRRVG